MANSEAATALGSGTRVCLPRSKSRIVAKIGEPIRVVRPRYLSVFISYEKDFHGVMQYTRRISQTVAVSGFMVLTC
jgi:hypothetical protein